MMRAVISLLLPLMLAGCVVTDEREGLPTGATLLDSQEGYCDGPLEIQSDPDVVIDEGESTTIAVDDDDDIEWECGTASTLDEGELRCPDGTSYVRITRQQDESAFTLECFGV